MNALPEIKQFTSNTGVKIYRIPLIVFPNGFVAYSFILLGAGPPTLIDTGSGFGDSNDHLVSGIQAVHDDFGESVMLQDIERLIITHGHIDHHGGAAFIVQQMPNAQVGIHPLDRRVLTNYEERLIIASKDIEVYLERAGIDPERREIFIAMYGFAKQHVQSIRVDFNLSEDQPLDGLEFIHVPGHCPGQVCIKIGDTLLSTDHILSHTTPHQSPELITPYTGLGHYQESLKKVARIDGIRLAVGSHEEAMDDVYQRIDDILTSHERKLMRVMDIMKQSSQPMTLDEVTQQMYPGKEGYETLLALEEAGAHMEYLYLHGQLSVANLDEVEKEHNPALRFVATT